MDDLLLAVGKALITMGVLGLVLALGVINPVVAILVAAFVTLTFVFWSVQ